MKKICSEAKYGHRSAANLLIRHSLFHVQLRVFTDTCWASKVCIFDPADAKAFFNRGIAEHNLKIQKESCLDVKKAKELGYQSADAHISTFCQYRSSCQRLFVKTRSRLPNTARIP